MNLYESLRDVTPGPIRHYYRGVNAVNIHLQCTADALPPLRSHAAPFSVRLMDHNDPADICAWLHIQRQGFGAQIDAAAFDRLVLNHPTYDIRRTYFLLENGEPVGVSSAGVYRGNRAIGVGHQTTILPHLRGRGCGLSLALYRFHSLVAEGLQSLETETTLFYRRAILNDFHMGFHPKLHRDSWNQRDTATRMQRLIASALLETHYLLWRARHA